ncbi:MAG: hypothetical protein RMJ16_08470 [Thermoguttaceae bacterium]|nr:hypothetical protein [Thermoguttaceae bacterium]
MGRGRVIPCISTTMLGRTSPGPEEFSAGVGAQIRLHFVRPHWPETNLMEWALRQPGDHGPGNHRGQTLEKLLPAGR